MALIPIRYADFYDVPRVFALEHRGSLYVFNCPFDEAQDDYPDSYTIYQIAGAKLPEGALSWADLIRAGREVGTRRVSEVRFDPSRRNSIDESGLPAA